MSWLARVFFGICVITYEYSVSDADGQILLIESAEFLPKWVSVATPELMQNRVFLAKGFR